MSNSTQSNKALDMRDQPDKIKADECGEVHENREVSCAQQAQQAQRLVRTIHRPLTLATSSPPVVGPSADSPCLERCSPDSMMESTNRCFANMHIDAQDTDRAQIHDCGQGADLTPCDSIAQAATTAAAAEEIMGLGSLDEILLKALKNRQERLFLLNLDQEFCNFIENASQKSLEFPCLNSYYRLMVHRSADYFKLERKVDHLQKIIISKTEHSAIPILRFCHLVEEDDEEVEEPQAYQEPEETKPIKVLKRCPARPPSACETRCKNESAFSSRSTRTLPMEEREKAYAEARARIFQENINCANHNLGGCEDECMEESLRQGETYESLSSPQRDDYPVRASAKVHSIRPKQSLDQLFGEATKDEEPEFSKER
ncbi:cAMP-regulated phosphoprotein 21 [Mortierella sp. AD094]|nr:cAMP-regulated phosphoprotein 21 [Mortierella sp. AD094]